MSKKMKSLDEILFKYTNEDQETIFSAARQEIDPWLYFTRLKDKIASKISEEEFEEFDNKINVFLESIDAANQTKMDHTVNRWWTEPDTNNPRFVSYNPRDFRRDVRGEVMLFVTESKVGSSTRNEWNRVTKFDSYELKMLTEYGNFNLGTTKKTAQAWLRVRTAVRNNTPFLSVGAIQINMHSGLAKCGVGNCKWDMQLEEDTDREGLEYQVLLILKHLGTHDAGNIKVFPRIFGPISPVRDEEADKMQTHREFCVNRKCRH